MNKRYLLLLMILSTQLLSFSQNIVVTCEDTVTIRFRAENRMRDLSNRMNFLTFSSTTQLNFEDSYSTSIKGQARTFYNDSVVISNDIDPELINSSTADNLLIKKYLNNLFSLYQKNEDDESTIFFTNIHCTNLKKTTYFYVNVYFDCIYKSKFIPSGKTYPKFSRVAEMIAEPNRNPGTGKIEWTVTIHSISFAKPGAFESDLSNEFTDITGAIDCDPGSIIGGIITDENRGLAIKASGYSDKAETYAARGNFEDAKSYMSRAASMDTSNLSYKLKLKDYQQELDKRQGNEKKSKLWAQQADYAYKFRRYHIADSLYSQLSMLDPSYRVPEGEQRKKEMSQIIARTEGLQGMCSRNQCEDVISQCNRYMETDKKAEPELLYWRAKAYATSNNPKRAIEDLTKAISLDNNYLDAYELRASIKMQNEDRAGALSDYSLLKSKDPKNEMYFVLSARAQNDMKNYTKAVSDYEGALQLNPENANTYYELGEIEFNNNESEIARKNFMRALEKQKSFPEANYYLGQIAMQNNTADRYQRAGEYFKLAISQGLNSEMKSLILKKADDFYLSTKDIGNPQNALAPLNCAIQIYDGKADYYVARGNAYSKLGDLKKAITDYRTACTLENTVPQNFYLLGISFYTNGQTDSAKYSFLKALDIKNNYYQAKIYLGHTYFKEKEYAKAVSYYDDALKLKKDSARIYYYIGNAYSQLHQPQQALDYYAKALDRDEEDPDFNVGRGNVYFDLNEYKQAIKDYSHALGHNPELAEALFHRAQCLVRMQDYDPALSDLNKYLQKHNSDPEAFRLRGICLMEKMNYPMAIEDFKSAKKLDKAYVSEPLLNKKLAYSYLKLNDPLHAMDCINQVLQSDQKNADALFYKGIALSMQNKMSEALENFKEAFATGAFSKKSVKNESLINSFAKNPDFVAVCNQYLH